jgi:hypothetical protein
MSYSAELFPIILAMTASGLLAGLLAGLMGIGGGIVIIPVLYVAFGTLGVSDVYLMHTTLGTTLAIVFFTGFLSSRSHYKRGSVWVSLVRRWALWIVVGSVLGSLLAPYIKNQALVMLFAILAFLMGLKFILSIKLASEPHDEASEPPRGGLHIILIGMFSSLMGIGGATFTVPLMTHYGVNIIKAVGSAATLGVFISFSATIGYMWSGFSIAGLPPFSIGFVNLLAVAVIAPLSMAMAPVGVMVAHKIPRRALSIIFGCFLIFTSIRMGAPELLPF